MKLFRAIAKKFKPALDGVISGFEEKSIKIQILLGIFVVIISFLFQFQLWEWIYVVLSIGIVITIEYINSSIEEVVDYLSPEYSVFAKKAKDLAAAAVLISSICVGIGYLIIIGGKLL